MRLDEFETWLYDHAWSLERVRGSHRRYRHSVTHYAVTVAVHGDREIPDYIVRHTLKRIERMRGTREGDTTA